MFLLFVPEKTLTVESVACKLHWEGLVRSFLKKFSQKMKTIKITTQQEFDSLPLSFDEFTEINIFSVNNINISKNISNSQVTARENSQVTARGNSQVTARGNSQVTARENSQVTAWENSQVTACGNSQVTAWENSQVTAWGNVCVHTYSNNSILLFGLSVAFLLSSSSKAIKKSKKSTIIKGIIKDGKVKNWIELEGLEIKNKSVILFKKVSKDFLTQENTPNETKWEIGKTKTIDELISLLKETEQKNINQMPQ